MAVPTFIQDHNGRQYSTTTLSVSIARGIISFFMAGVLVGQENFGAGGLAQAQAQYSYYQSILNQSLGAPTISIPSTGSPFEFSYAATIGNPPSPFYLTGTNFSPGGVVTFGGIAIPTTITSATNCIATYTFVTLTAATYDVVYTGPDSQIATVTGGLVIDA